MKALKDMNEALSRIVGEAMSSHRPYRAASGLEAMLAALAGQRGTKLDAAVVDACFRLFRKKNFTFERIHETSRYADVCR